MFKLINDGNLEMMMMKQNLTEKGKDIKWSFVYSRTNCDKKLTVD